MQCPVMDRRSATSPPSSASASAAEVSTTTTTSSAAATVEKEHMFEKVVTPSDVGKLNRLVIPKQHAERYFPTSEREGLTLSFEDRDGKAWRFRYSYWNSSQSYVMTRGWSRFVKDKRLDAGDTVAFGRGVDDKGRFFIDCQRRRPPAAAAAARIIDPPPPPPAYRILWAAPAAAAYINAAAAAGTAFGSAAVDPRRAERGDGMMGAKRVRLFGVNLDSSPRNDSEIAFCSSSLRLLEGKEEEEEDPSLDLQM